MNVATLTQLAAPPSSATSFIETSLFAGNPDSTSVNGVEVGVAHVDADTDRVTARLLRQAAIAVRDRS